MITEFIAIVKLGLYYSWLIIVIPIGLILLLRKMITKDGMNSSIDTGPVNEINK